MERNGEDKKNKAKPSSQNDKNGKQKDKNSQKKEYKQGKFADPHLEETKDSKTKPSTSLAYDATPTKSVESEFGIPTDISQLVRPILDDVLIKSDPNESTSQHPIIPPSTRKNIQKPPTCKYHISL